MQAGFCQQVEQDCNGAIPVCQNTYVQNSSYVGNGFLDELVYPNNTSCLQSGEQNSVWYIFTVSGAGQLIFQITPNFIFDDYDWDVFDLTGHTCADIGTGAANEIRCNWSANPGSTGLQVGAIQTSVSAAGPNQCSPMNVVVGETYVLMINNYSGSTNGYTLNFSGTAQIFDNVPPTADSLAALQPCQPVDSITVLISEQITCASIANDGTDFFITDALGNTFIPIGASGVGCSSGLFTNEVVVHLASQISAGGNYVLHIQNGSDGNTLLDNCGNALLNGDTLQFNLPSVTAGFTSAETPGCGIYTINFSDTSVGNIANYQWAFGDGNSSVLQNPSNIYFASGSYTVSLNVTDALGCQDSATQSYSFIIDQPFTVTLGSDTGLCLGESIVLDAGNTGANYVWSTGETTQSISIIDIPKFISVIVTNGHCTSYDSILVDLSCDVIIPTAFTPNGDGLNDDWQIIYKNIHNLTLNVYNRWGELIWQTTDPSKFWDGINHGHECEIGSYVYYLEVGFDNGEKIQRKGNVTLIR